MPRSDQGALSGRYSVIPRTLIFIRSGDNYLLIKGSETKRLWAGKYNGVGGHVERGEDIAAAARRELLEETGLEADLRLCGTVIVDAGEIGVCVYIFSGNNTGGKLITSAEGEAEWIQYDKLMSLPFVDDVPALLARVHAMQPLDHPFSARSFYDSNRKLQVVFSD